MDDGVDDEDDASFDAEIGVIGVVEEDDIDLVAERIFAFEVTPSRDAVGVNKKELSGTTFCCCCCCCKSSCCC